MDKTILYLNYRMTSNKNILIKILKKIKRLPQYELGEAYSLVQEDEVITIMPLWILDNENEITKTVIQQICQHIRKKEIFFSDIWYAPKLSELLKEYNGDYPLSFFQYIYKQFSKVETIYLKEDGQSEIMEFAEDIYTECNKMVVWIPNKEVFAERNEEWTQLAEIIYDNTGLAIEILEALPPCIALGKDKWKRKYQTLFFDFSTSQEIAYRMIPKKTIYIDFYPNKQKRKVFTEKRRDVTYLTYANFLDENPKIRYNTEVTKT